MGWIKCIKNHLVIYLIFILANAHTDCVSDMRGGSTFGSNESLGLVSVCRQPLSKAQLGSAFPCESRSIEVVQSSGQVRHAFRYCITHSCEKK